VLASSAGARASSARAYLDTREDLLDLMSDSIAADYVYTPPSGDWLAARRPPTTDAPTATRRSPTSVTIENDFDSCQAGPVGSKVCQHP
jgi:hypothetical protein